MIFMLGKDTFFFFKFAFLKFSVYNLLLIKVTGELN